MQKIIKPIPTQFNGEIFKSRLEARWAVFFQMVGIEAHYEIGEWRNAEGLTYMPDFGVMWGIQSNRTNQRPFFEIKPTRPNSFYLDKIMRVRDPKLSDLFICVGDPSFQQPHGYWIESKYVFKDNLLIGIENVIREGFAFNQCPVCKKYSPFQFFEIDGVFYEEDVDCCDSCLFPPPKDWKQAAIDCKYFRFDL